MRRPLLGLLLPVVAHAFHAGLPSAPLRGLPSSAPVQMLAARPKRIVSQAEKRKAGVRALRELANIYRERAKQRDAPQPAQPAQAAQPVQQTRSATPPPGLLDTFSALFVAKAELAVLRARDRVTGSIRRATDKVRAAPETLARRARALLDEAKAELEEELARSE